MTLIFVCVYVSMILCVPLKIHSFYQPSACLINLEQSQNEIFSVTLCSLAFHILSFLFFHKIFRVYQILLSNNFHHLSTFGSILAGSYSITLPITSFGLEFWIHLWNQTLFSDRSTHQVIKEHWLINLN